MGHRNESDRVKGPWSPGEDELLQILVEKHGPMNWSLISKSISGRSGKSCRLRWCNQLSPRVEHLPFTPEEDETIVRAHALFGNKWAAIARMLSGRTDNSVKNHWNSTLKRKCSPEADPPGKRSASVRPGFCFNPGSPTGSDVGEGFCFNPGRPTGSDLGEPSYSGHPVYRPGDGGISPPHPQPEPVTTLCLSLPGSDLNPSSLIEPAPNSNPTPAPTPGFVLPKPIPTDPPSPPPAALQSFEFFNSEFLAVMHEMVRKEVRNYMVGE